MSNQNIQNNLSDPFQDCDIEWRLQWVSSEKTSGIAVPYVDNRAIQARLDTVVGIWNWRNEYIPWHNATYTDGNKNKRQVESQICGISIYCAERKEWITKYDGAEDSEIEPVKGGLSDSMKRAAVQWGIGRYLYTMDVVFVDVEFNKKDKPEIKATSKPKLNAAHQACVKKVFGGHGQPASPNTPQRTAVKPDISATQKTPPASAQTTPPNGCYEVVNAVHQPSMNGGYNTNLQLKDASGKVIQAYMQGTDEGMVIGTRIVNARITSKMKEGIAFHTLDEFQYAAPQAA